MKININFLLFLNCQYNQHKYIQKTKIFIDIFNVHFSIYYGCKLLFNRLWRVFLLFIVYCKHSHDDLCIGKGNKMYVYFMWKINVVKKNFLQRLEASMKWMNAQKKYKSIKNLLYIETWPLKNGNSIHLIQSNVKYNSCVYCLHF